MTPPADVNGRPRIPGRTSRLRAWAVILAVLSFGLGVLATRWWLAPGDPANPAGIDAGSPQLLIDAGGIELLPDASLHLDLPRQPKIDP